MKIPRKIKSAATILKTTTVKWLERDPFRNSTVIAYYTIFSMPGLLVIIINVAGYFFGDEAVMQKISTQVGGLIGSDTAKDVEAIVAKASAHKDFTISSAIGIATLLFGATGVFYQLQQTLNLVWDVKPQPQRMLIKFALDRIFSFGLILAVGFLLLVSLVLSTMLTVVSDWVATYISDYLNIFFRFLDFALSMSVITLLFASIFKFLPDAEIEWKDVWIGALVTAFLFVLAKFALSLYFANADPASTYGAAGSVILIMLWVTYAGMILLFGAEFTRVYASHCGTRINPSEFAVATHHNDNKDDSAQ
jgi:membrane protein